MVKKLRGIEEVQAVVTQAQRRYESSRGKSKSRELLGQFSALLCHYDNIIEVFVQHHPEYVALAWGAMKFLFVVSDISSSLQQCHMSRLTFMSSFQTFINYEHAVSALAKGLYRIGSVLPRVGLAFVLYPTKRMKCAVAELYAYILRFLIRARGWYGEGRLKHVWHSISRPPELRYSDLMEEIKERSEIVDQLAVSGARAEQREIHRKLDAETSQLSGLREQIRQMREAMSGNKCPPPGEVMSND
jgi:hypothetical protein